MKITTRYFLLLFLLCGSIMSFAQAPYRIWFDKPIDKYDNKPAWLINDGYGGNPDQNWEKYTLPIGNGAIGANVFGNISEERITFNEKTLWSGGPNIAKDPSYYWNINKNSAHLLPTIRQAFLDGDGALAAKLTRDNFNGLADYDRSGGEKPFRFGSFSTMGEFRIATGLPDSYEQYTKELNLNTATVDVAFKQNGVNYHRSYFCSYPDSTFIIKFSADVSSKQNLSFRYLMPSNAEGEFKVISNNHLRFLGHLKDNKQEFALDILCDIKDGALKASSQGFSIEGANEVTFKIVASTDYFMNFNPDFKDAKTYVGESAALKNDRKIARIISQSYDQLYNNHVADYQNLFNRVDLNLNTEMLSLNIPTDQRLKRYKEGNLDYYLESLYFQFGRYLLISSSRKGSLPANLQGIWHNNIDGPWHVDYHNNINLQMNYWPVSIANLNECAEPLFDFIKTLVKPGRVTAESYFGTRGWTASISGNIYGFTAPLSSKDMSWNFNPMAGPWLATHIWDYYDYTRDTEFLKKNYSILKESAQFAVDFMWKRDNGLYTATPSTSPEHGPVDQGATFVHAVVKEVLLDAIQASIVLKCDKKERKEWQNVLDKIYPYKIGRYGQLQEWYDDIDDPKDNHRHVNHLYGLHPGRTISPVTTKELAEASKVVLEHRGDFATGWSMGWKLNQWARLHDGNHSYTLYQNLLKQGTLPNLWDTHPPFQIDGNFGGTAGIAEMLLQSHMGFIHILPALPDAWKEGSVTGLMARGNFTIDMKWENGALTNLIVTSNKGESCTLHYLDSKLSFKTQKGKSYSIKFINNKLIIE